MFVSKERTKLTAVVTALRVDRVALCATRSLLSLWGHCSRAGRSEHTRGPGAHVQPRASAARPWPVFQRRAHTGAGTCVSI